MILSRFTAPVCSKGWKRKHQLYFLQTAGSKLCKMGIICIFNDFFTSHIFHKVVFLHEKQRLERRWENASWGNASSNTPPKEPVAKCIAHPRMNLWAIFEVPNQSRSKRTARCENAVRFRSNQVKSLCHCAKSELPPLTYVGCKCGADTTKTKQKVLRYAQISFAHSFLREALSWKDSGHLKNDYRRKRRSRRPRQTYRKKFLLLRIGRSIKPILMHVDKKGGRNGQPMD